MTVPDVIETKHEEDGTPYREVLFLDREFHVREPSDEQMLALVRMGKLRDPEQMTAERMLATLNRAPELCVRLCARDEDATWIDDALVANDIKVGQLPEFMAEVIRVWWGQGNRAGRRTAAKKAPVARRAR